MKLCQLVHMPWKSVRKQISYYSEGNMPFSLQTFWIVTNITEKGPVHLAIYQISCSQNFFPHMQLSFTRPVNRLWCVKIIWAPLKQPLEGLPWNLVQTFMVPREWMVEFMVQSEMTQLQLPFTFAQTWIAFVNWLVLQNFGLFMQQFI